MGLRDNLYAHGLLYLRQGNQNPEVRISQIVTVGSFDTYMWQTLERKARFIGQVMAGTVTDRQTGDIGADELQYAEVKALSSGNPMLLELAQAEQDLSRYRRLERAHHTNLNNLRSTAVVSARTLAQVQAEIPHLEAAAAATVATNGEAFRMRIAGADYTKRPEAAAALDAWIHTYGRLRLGVDRDYGPLIDVGGHQITVSTDGESLTWTVADAPSVATHDQVRDLLAKPMELGHITRLENLPGRIENSLTRHRVQLQELAKRIGQAETGLDKPFKYGDELRAAEDRYDQITTTMAAQRDEPALVSVAAAPSASSATARADRVSGLLAQARAKLNLGHAEGAPRSPHLRPERTASTDIDRAVERD